MQTHSHKSVSWQQRRLIDFWQITGMCRAQQFGCLRCSHNVTAMQSWGEHWQTNLFHRLYGWLVGQLHTTLIPPDAPGAPDPFWQHLLCAAVLCCAVALLSLLHVLWVLLKHGPGESLYCRDTCVHCTSHAVMHNCPRALFSPMIIYYVSDPEYQVACGMNNREVLTGFEVLERSRRLCTCQATLLC